MLRLKLRLASREDFAKFVDPAAGVDELFVPTGEPPPVGTDLLVEVLFARGPRILLKSTVKWRRTSWDTRTRPGVGVGIYDSESSKMAYLLGYVRGGLLDVREKRRLPVRLRVAYTSRRGRRVNFTRDLNEEGAFVRAAEPLPAGSETLLLISPPGGEYKPIEVHGVVARLQGEGDARGMGVQFRFADSTERDRLEAFVAKLENDYLEGALPDNVLL